MPRVEAYSTPAVLMTAALLSGAAGLVYQVVWTRQLTLVLGHTVAAISTVLAAFMGGLGLGSALAARSVDAVDRAALARLYAGLEAGIAAVGLALLAHVVLPLPAAAWTRFAFGAAAVLLPATLMGATLPTLAALARPPADRLAGAAGRLYAANTAGAVLGSLATVAVFLPQLGVTRSTVVAATLNLGAAGLALWWAGRGVRAGSGTEAGAPGLAKRHAGKRRDKEGTPPEGLPSGLVLTVVGLSSLGALADEVAWTRALVLLVGPTAYAFAFIVSAVIAGLALGSTLAARVADRLVRPGLALATVELLAAAACVAVVRVLGQLPIVAASLVRDHADHMGRLMALQFAGVLVLLLFPGVLFGAALPLAVRLLGRGRAGEALGRAGAASTFGAIGGALLAGFVALPVLGLRGTLLAAAGTQLLAGLLALLPLLGLGARLGTLALAAAGGASALLLAPPWDKALFAGGAYKYAPYARAGRLEDALRAGELIFYRDGRVATVSVKRLGGALSLAVDGKVDATSTADMLTQRLLAHLPLLLHPDPQDVLVIGLGSGVTAGSALVHPVRALETVEVAAEVAEAARLFRHVNHEALEDPRLRLVIADGRQHLLTGGRAYDVVISEPSNPWMAGVAGLFSRDFFALARSRLRPGGLMCQWAHVYNMSPQDLRTLVGGFSDVFPASALFLVNEGDVLLLGARDAFPAPTAEALAERLRRPQVRDDLAAVELRSSFGLASLLALYGPDLAAWVKDAPRHTDDRPVLEFSAPRFLHADTAADNRRRIQDAGRRASLPEPFASLTAHPTADQLVERARMLEGSEGYAWAMETFGAALARAPGAIDAAEGLVRTALRLGRAAQAEEQLERLAGSAARRVGLALLAHSRNRPAEALALLAEAAPLDPRNRRVLILGAEVQEATGNLEAAAGLAQAALDLDPQDAEAQALLASVALAGGRWEEAGRRAEAVLSREPRQARALEVAAIAHARTGDRTAARRCFGALLLAQPDSWGALNNYGVFELEQGDARAAASLFRQAVTLHPGNVGGFRGLREAALLLGDSALVAHAEANLVRLGAP